MGQTAEPLLPPPPAPGSGVYEFSKGLFGCSSDLDTSVFKSVCCLTAQVFAFYRQCPKAQESWVISQLCKKAGEILGLGKWRDCHAFLGGLAHKLNGISDTVLSIIRFLPAALGKYKTALSTVHLKFIHRRRHDSDSESQNLQLDVWSLCLRSIPRPAQSPASFWVWSWRDIQHSHWKTQGSHFPSALVFIHCLI